MRKSLRENRPEPVVALGMMIREQPRPIVGKCLFKRGAEFFRGERIGSGNAGGKIDQAGFIGLPHEIHEAAPGLKDERFVHLAASVGGLFTKSNPADTSRSLCTPFLITIRQTEMRECLAYEKQ